MMNKSRKLISAIATVVAPLVFIVGCSAGDRVTSEAAPEVSKEPATAVVKKGAEAPAPADEKITAEVRDVGSAALGKSGEKKPEIVARDGAVAAQSSIYLGSDGKMAGTGDPSKPVSEAYKLGMSERPAALAGAGLAKDKFGLIDWVAVVNAGAISPIGSLEPGKPEIPPFEMDIVIEAKGDFVNNVVFPHNSHTYWLSCENCHPAIFVMGKGKNKMSMVEISEGKWCGECHGKVAFPLTDCARCHTQKKG